MSRTVQGYTIIGIRVERGAFFAKMGEQWACSASHIRPPDETYAFCPKCGGRYTRRDVETFTEGFRAFAERTQTTPELLWRDLWEGGYRSGYYSPTGVFKITAVQGYDDDAPLALGFRLKVEDDDRDIQSIDWGQAKSQVFEIIGLAKGIGILEVGSDAKVEIFACLYLS